MGGELGQPAGKPGGDGPTAEPVSRLHSGQLTPFQGGGADLHLHHERYELRRHEPVPAIGSLTELFDAAELHGPVSELGDAGGHSERQPDADTYTHAGTDTNTERQPDPNPGPIAGQPELDRG